MDPVFLAGIVLVLLLVAVISIRSGKNVKTAVDFAQCGGRAGMGVVMGAILGTMIGGATTVGTAQLAYSYGISAWCFTLGLSLGCVLLALFFVKPIRAMNAHTFNRKIGTEFGGKAAALAALFSVAGSFISLIGQLAAGSATLGILFPNLSELQAGLLAAACMAIYVIFGGVWSAGMVGIAKVILVYLAVIASAGLAMSYFGSFSVLFAAFDHGTYFNLFARGVGTDLGGGLSIALGALCNQAFAQMILAGRSGREVRRGVLVSAALIPPISVGGILAGLYMRATDPPAMTSSEAALAEAARSAFPRFIMEHMPPLPAGIILAALFLAVVGAGAGIVLGISTIVREDLTGPFSPRPDSRGGLRFSRLCILAVLLAGVLAMLGSSDTILDITFLGTGWRVAVVLLPLCAAFFLPGRIRPGFAAAAMTAGAVCTPLAKVLALPVNPVFFGVAACFVIMAAGAAAGPGHTRPTAPEQQNEKVRPGS